MDVRSEDEEFVVLTTGGTHLASALKRLALPWRATKFSSVVPSRVVTILDSSNARLRFSGEPRVQNNSDNDQEIEILEEMEGNGDNSPVKESRNGSDGQHSRDKRKGREEDGEDDLAKKRPRTGGVKSGGARDERKEEEESTGRGGRAAARKASGAWSALAGRRRTGGW
mmetsp:Transcript_4880/g.17720  ORF Transcript_4880/g.17720 Transcript_4880/m.17720 type:complete len:169 (+) Transcript_4880:1082-1588(+)